MQIFGISRAARVQHDEISRAQMATGRKFQLTTWPTSAASREGCFDPYTSLQMSKCLSPKKYPSQKITQNSELNWNHPPLLKSKLEQLQAHLAQAVPSEAPQAPAIYTAWISESNQSSLMWTPWCERIRKQKLCVCVLMFNHD